MHTIICLAMILIIAAPLTAAYVGGIETLIAWWEEQWTKHKAIKAINKQIKLYTEVAKQQSDVCERAYFIARTLNLIEERKRIKCR